MRGLHAIDTWKHIEEAGGQDMQGKREIEKERERERERERKL